ncbi:MAG: aldose 1-epimerase [Isosphaeraceae bacterium]
MAHRITTKAHGDRTVFTLHDDTSGASASILPSYGFNLFDLRLPVAGEVGPVLSASPDFPDDPKSPGRNGTPVLFPFPNRINQARFTFQGKTYQLPVNSGTHAIHGFAVSAPWDVVEQSTEGGSASLTGRFQLGMNAPEMRAFWPTDAAIRIKYALAGRRVTMTVTVTNPTADDLPYGFGIHPYFFCPFTQGADLGPTKVILPARQVWVLEGFIPTGERARVDGRMDFREGKSMKGLKLDDVFTDLEYEGDHLVCRLVDEALGAEFRMTCDRAIRELVAYTPPGAGGVISIEPYTQTTDAINLASRGIDGGLRILPHGASETFTILMETVG